MKQHKTSWLFRPMTAVLMVISLVALIPVQTAVWSQYAPAVPPSAGIITGIVWHDLDTDGVRDANEPPLSNVLITLMTADENGSCGNSLLTATTNADGSYAFTDLSSAYYCVEETDPAGYVSTTDNQVWLQLPADSGVTVDFGDFLPPTVTPVPSPPVEKITVQVADSLDDTSVQPATGLNRVLDPILRVGRSNLHYDNGLRFPSLSLPADANVLTATLWLHPYGWQTGFPITLTAYAEAVDSAANFTDTNPLVHQRNRTMAAVDWVIAEEVTTWFASPNLASLLQEVISRPGWNEGNPLALFLFSSDDANPYVDVTAWDDNPTEAAWLEITFSPPPGEVIPTPSATMTPLPTATPSPTPTVPALQPLYFPLVPG